MGNNYTPGGVVHLRDSFSWYYYRAEMIRENFEGLAKGKISTFHFKLLFYWYFI